MVIVLQLFTFNHDSMGCVRSFSHGHKNRQIFNTEPLKVLILKKRVFDFTLLFAALPVIRRSASDKLKSNSTGTFKELNSLSAPSNQQVFISALQKLADKQSVRQYASSSHINLLTQQVRPPPCPAERLLAAAAEGNRSLHSEMTFCLVMKQHAS